jgi:5-methylcytosine-specific restriction endonuclease McrA
MSKRKVTESVKKSVAAKQDFKCANFPGSNIISDYECVYHQCRSGTFDEAGYEIDHVVEFSETQDDKISNLQALCIPCHRVKTTRFNRKKRKAKAKAKVKAKVKVKSTNFKIKKDAQMLNIYKECFYQPQTEAEREAEKLQMIKDCFDQPQTEAEREAERLQMYKDCFN